MIDAQASVRAVDVRHLTRRFGSVAAVDDLTLAVRGGEIHGLLGSNGAGKTTLIKMLTTLLPPREGEAFVAGASILDAPAQVRRRIGYVPQMLSADGMLTGRENLVFSVRLYDIPAGERSRRIADALDFMELSEVAGRLVKTYSGGMIRRLELAHAMLHRPVVLAWSKLGLGVAAVPSMAMPGPDHPLLVSVPLVDPVVTRKVGLIRRRGRSLSPAAQQLFDLFGEVKGRRGALRRG